MWVCEDKAWRSCEFSCNERFNEKEEGSKLNPFVEFIDTMYPQNPFQPIVSNRVEEGERQSRESRERKEKKKMATFTKKHYREIAKVLSKAKLRDEVDQWLEIRDNFINLFKRDNERFNKELFIIACAKEVR